MNQGPREEDPVADEFDAVEHFSALVKIYELMENQVVDVNDLETIANQYEEC